MILELTNDEKITSLPSYLTSSESGKAIKSFMIHPDQRAVILGKAVRERPDLPEEWKTPEGKFKIHYTISGSDAVNSMCTNQYGIPDWVYETGKAAEYSYRLLVDTLGFSPPPVDSKEEPQIDIYIKNWAGSYYAMTYLEDEVQSTERPYDYTSYMVIDNDYTESDYYTHGFDALRVTVSHEFFHMVQLGYNWWEDNGLPGVSGNGDMYFLEWNSVWFEERAWPNVNDYYAYLGDFFNDPVQSLWYTQYSYSLGFFLRYILDNYIGEENLVEIWEKIKTDYAFQSLEDILRKEAGVKLSDVWNEFCHSCYYTGHRYNEQLSPSPDAMDFPLLDISKASDLIFADTTTFYFRANPFSTNPLRLTFSENKLIGINEQSEMTDNFIGSFVLDKNSSQDIILKISLNNNTYIGEAQPLDTLVIFITNVTMEDTIDANLAVSEFPDSVEYQTKLLAVYPNPFIYYLHSDLKFDFQVGTHFKDLNIYFYNLLGQKVFEKTYNSASLNIGLNSICIPFGEIKNLPSGVYIASFELGSKRISKKFTIVK